MRTCEANYDAVKRELHSHQSMTLSEIARARGEADWTAEPVCRSVAVTLAVENMLRALIEGRHTERQALMRIAILLDIDFETLQRQRRRHQKRRDSRTESIAAPK